jgi:hypothetical protein
MCDVPCAHNVNTLASTLNPVHFMRAITWMGQLEKFQPSHQADYPDLGLAAAMYLARRTVPKPARD